MEELVQLETETLKDAAQRLWRYMPAPMCDGKLIPADVYGAYQPEHSSGSANRQNSYADFLCISIAVFDL